MNLFRNILFFLSIITYLILIVDGSIEENEIDTNDDKSYGEWNNEDDWGHHHQAPKNGIKCEVEKVILNAVYLVGVNNCTVEICYPITFNYIVVVNGKKIKTVVNFTIVRVISNQGSVNSYRFGKAEAGYMMGALVAEVYDSPNPDPGACDTKTGVTELKSDFVTITFKKDNESFTCWGKNIEYFTPGLRNPKS